MEKPLKIVLALGSRHTIPPVSNSSGVAWILYHIAKRLSKQKFDIHVISKWNDELEEGFDSIYHHINLDTKTAKAKMRFWKRVPYRMRKKLFTFSQPDRIVYYQGIRKKMKQIKPDLVLSVVHSELFYMLHKAYPQAKHAYWYHSSDIFGLEKRLTDYLFSNTEGVLVLNNLTVNSIKTQLPDINIPISRIYNALDLSVRGEIDESKLREQERAKYNFKKDDIVIGYAGRFAREKNIMSLFKAVKELVDKRIPVKLLMAGDINNEKMPDWDYYNKCIEYANENIKDSLFFVGWMSNKELSKFYCAIDLGVLLSQEKEGSPMFFLEACSFGKPMIATSVGSNPEHLEHGVNGFLLDVANIDKELPNLILKIVEDKVAYSDMSKNCRKYIKEHHSYDDKVIEFEKFLLEVDA
ncbi:glycosyltransferase family 4 protein [Saccharicrinis aurantiacus]|uniref:glycosyltransferase family 4 protein n=1 Tax=Saccharicrinis aurantiacus TaxID=1849719 RepID=UPI00083914A0|nr:glycosyltransferase family 4 protein [Saccharicrinis aurantiacus]